MKLDGFVAAAAAAVAVIIALWFTAADDPYGKVAVGAVVALATPVQAFSPEDVRRLLVPGGNPSTEENSEPTQKDIVYETEPVCPFDYVHLKTVLTTDNFVTAKTAKGRDEGKDNTAAVRLQFRSKQIQRRLGSTNRQINDRELTNQPSEVLQLNNKTPQTPPITIIRQGDSFVEFKINQNSTWFTSETASAISDLPDAPGWSIRVLGSERLPGEDWRRAH